jgi:hypothetical protein
VIQRARYFVWKNGTKKGGKWEGGGSMNGHFEVLKFQNFTLFVGRSSLWEMNYLFVAKPPLCDVTNVMSTDT